MNIGEESEHYLKAFLLKQKYKKLSDTVFGVINELSDDGNLSEIMWKNEAEPFLESFDIPNMIKTLGITKSRGSSKADITINGVSYSVKEMGASPPAIVNHTPRHGFENACTNVGSSITTLDKIITEYWKLREGKIIKEDTKISNPNCPFIPYKSYLKPIIEYFLFTGTGRSISNFPATKILEINYKKLPVEIRIFEKDNYFEQVWDKLVFSIRSKGMPKKYPNCVDKDSIAKWTKKTEKKYKGALHIRVNK